MYLIQIDSNNTVISSVLDLEGPQLTPLNESYLLSSYEVSLGQLFDPGTRTFVAPAKSRWITRRAFRNRFSNSETLKIELALSYLSRSDATEDQRNVAAQVSAFQREISDGPYVDLSLPEVTAGINWMWYVTGIMDSLERVGVFLDASIEAHEYHPDA